MTFGGHQHSAQTCITFHVIAAFHSALPASSSNAGGKVAANLG